jgi:transcriptional regulator with XRE-family HTH domain
MAELDRKIAELGEFIKGQRERSQLSLRRLAEQAGVSNPYLSQIERGLRKPSAEILQQLAKALHISAETLFERAGWLDPDDDEPRGGVREAIALDPRLNDEQRLTLSQVYDALVRSTAEEPINDAARPAVADVDDPRRGFGGEVLRDDVVDDVPRDDLGDGAGGTMPGGGRDG